VISSSISGAARNPLLAANSPIERRECGNCLAVTPWADLAKSLPKYRNTKSSYTLFMVGRIGYKPKASVCRTDRLALASLQDWLSRGQGRRAGA
jgi:hypothetical protein